jgi:hypothetical protein
VSGLRRRLITLGGAAACLLPAATSAFAEEPVETAIRDLVAAIDASPAWAATYRDLSYDAATATATVSDLAIATEQGDAKVNFQKVAVAEYAAAAGGGFTARSITADGGSVSIGPAKIAITDVGLNDLAIPAMSGAAYDAQRPFTSLIRIYSQILGVKLRQAHIGSIALREEIGGITSLVSYQNFQMDNFSDGKVAAVRTGPLKLETPSPDGLVAMTVESVESSNIDLGAFIRVSDPEAYVNGAGDLVWHQAIGTAAYRNLEMELPGAKLAIGSFSIDDFKVRQPRRSFAGFLDTMLANPDMSEPAKAELAKKNVFNMLAAFGVGRYQMTGLNVSASGLDKLAVGEFHVSELSSDGLGEFGVSGVEGAVEGQGSVKIGKFGFGGIAFPPIDLVVAAIDAEDKGETFDTTKLVPKLGFIEAGGLDIQTPDIPRTTLGKFRIDLGKYVGFVPTSIAAEVSDLDVPTAIMERDAREMFARIGHDRIVMSYGLKLGWDEASETVTVDDFHVGVKDLGSVAVAAALAGLARAAIENPDLLSEAIPNLALRDAKITFTDESIVGKGLEILAEKMRVPADKFRQQFADALPFLLSISALNNPAIMAIVKQSGLLTKLTPAIKTFVAAPGSLILSLAPATPVSLAAITAAAEAAPETLPALLNLSITAEPAAKPPGAPSPAAPAPAEPAAPLRPTIAPAN